MENTRLIISKSNRYVHALNTKDTGRFPDLCDLCDIWDAGDSVWQGCHAEPVADN